MSRPRTTPAAPDWRAAAATLSALALATACSSGTPHPTPPAPTTAAPSPSPSQAASPSQSPADPQAATKAAVLAQYRAFWAAYDAALTKNDYVDTTGLTKTTNGKVFTYFVDEATTARADGRRFRGETTLLHPTVTLVAAQKATVTDCVDTGTMLFAPKGSASFRQQGFTTGDTRDLTYDATFTLTKGVWLMSAFHQTPGGC